MSAAAAWRRRAVSWVGSPFAGRLAAIALGAVFIAAAAVKIQDPPGFAHEVSNYGLLPAAAVNPVALVLPWAELLGGLALILGPGRRGASLLLTLLLVVFIAGLGANLVRGKPVDCGCFSTAAEARTPEQRLAAMRLAVLRDIGFLALAWGSFRAPARSRKHGANPGDHPSVPSDG